jgi:SET domain-containing protein
MVWIAGRGERSVLSSLALNQPERFDVEVRPSPIHGLGLFARRTFSTGEAILARDERPVTAERPLNAGLGEFDHHCDWLEGGRQVYLGVPERYINHSCAPNAFLRIRDGVSTVVALRPIRPRDEIVLHYGVNLSGGLPWRCDCHAEACLGVLPGSFFSLPEDVQLELSPLLAPWFVTEHRDACLALLREAGLPEDALS